MSMVLDPQETSPRVACSGPELQKSCLRIRFRVQGSGLEVLGLDLGVQA